MIKRIILILGFLPVLAQAQLNESDTLKLKANLSLSGLYQGGNVETIIFRAKNEVTYKPLKRWVFKTTNSYIYQEFGKTKADEDILSLNFLSFNADKRLYPQILGFFSTNFRRKIDYRYLVGTGVTYQILTKEKNWLKTAISSEFERTNFNETSFNVSQYNGLSSIETFRATLWLNGKHHLFKGKVIFGHQSYFQPSIEESDNYRWSTDLSLEFPLLKYLNFKINYLHTVESVVIANQKESDQFLTFGFTIKSY
jgi:hypothetical protein